MNLWKLLELEFMSMTSFNDCYQARVDDVNENLAKLTIDERNALHGLVVKKKSLQSDIYALAEKLKQEGK